MTGLSNLARRGRAILLVAPAAWATFAHAGTLLVFGDSLSDTGRLWAVSEQTFGQGVPPSEPGLYWQGRFTNGPVAVEVMAQTLGLTLDSRAWGGAFSGQGNLLGNSGPLADSGLQGQVGAYLVEQPTVGPDIQIVLWAGLNDLVLSPTTATAARAVVNLEQAARGLIAAGSTSLLLPQSPDLGASPWARALQPDTTARYTAASLALNTGVQSLVARLAGEYPDVHILTFDTPGVLAAEQARQGWITDAACVDGDFFGVEGVCTQPEQHLYWDGTHPSAAAHRHLGWAMAQAVPEPATWMLQGLGLLALGGQLARRRGARVQPAADPRG